MKPIPVPDLYNVGREGRDTCFHILHLEWNNEGNIPGTLLEGHKTRERPPATRPGKKRRRRAQGSTTANAGGDDNSGGDGGDSGIGESNAGSEGDVAESEAGSVTGGPGDQRCMEV
ncbi:uncharacterized protein PITG_09172 [Phytophthora infestans T30-4]|uniref:Uncharacterized protein n=1 Tax=Phytophthora infestans (strain T30-4) TaxID=403677 RepID=D0NBV2_PHYIT|nr:uncharacterized protein PITG_09172 [Phytophthora infestans T30-4]EEY55257.1 hypothetical protein PITG_09172 [Phytophthora infestans T30-4]|eukprot:XP_002903481.1 hypothetical protein PITG_09172 [Phytophthora infestans T30-4]